MPKVLPSTLPLAPTTTNPASLWPFLLTHLGPPTTGALGACLVEGPSLTPACEAILDRAIHEPTGTAYKEVKLEVAASSKHRRIRRPTDAETAVKIALRDRLAALGLQANMRDVAAPVEEGEDSQALASLTVFMRSLPGCGKQKTHVDRANKDDPEALTDLPLGSVPLSVIWAIEDGTTILVHGKRYEVPRNHLLIFRGDLCHAGDEYQRRNTRIHAYLDLADGRFISPWTTFCSAA